MYCRGCDRQTSPTAGTILHNSRTPIRKWFVAVWLLCTQKTGVSAKTLQRELNVGYKTAWLMLHKLRRATGRAERSLLRGTVEVDETYVGGAEHGVGGRQLVGKALVVIAVELDGLRLDTEQDDLRSRVSRGGGFGSTAAVSRSSFRDKYVPGVRGFFLGLRPCRVIEMGR